MNSLLSFLRRPYVLVLIALIALADVSGIIHSFRMHGTKDGVIALALPPYGLYRAAEGVMHQSPFTDADVEKLAQTEEGRDALRQALHLKPEVWGALLGFIGNDKNHEFRTSMEETGVPFDITAGVPASGPVTLTVQPRQTPDLTIIMTDEDRNQEPETLTITNMVNGTSEVHDTPIAKYNSDDASQFLFAWSLAWGTIAEELKAQAVSVSVSQ